MTYRFSKRMLRIQTRLFEDPSQQCHLQPVSIYWGRANEKRGSVARGLVSERYVYTSSFRRLTGLILLRTDVLVHFASTLQWEDAIDRTRSLPQNLRHIARILRGGFEKQRQVSLGPRLQSRKQVIDQLVSLAQESDSEIKRPNQTRRAAKQLVANLSYPTMRLLRLILFYFWRSAYDDIKLTHLDRIQDIAKTHTLVYVPNHRSHIDYLVLSYFLFLHGYAIPYIAAGENLNLPVVGPLLRRCGAFFMRRSFRDDPYYRNMLQNYLELLVREGTSIEFFIEGTRSRSGWMLEAQKGFLHMLMELDARGLSRPIALVPVYISHEKLIEIGSYQKELSGFKKQRESILDLFRTLRLIPKNMGSITTKVGYPIDLTSFVAENGSSPRCVVKLANQVVESINDTVFVSPTNLLALAVYSFGLYECKPSELIQRMDFLKGLLRVVSLQHDYTLTDLSAVDIVARAEALDLLTIKGDKVDLSTESRIELGWYRNNVLHTLVTPALLAVILLHQHEPTTRSNVIRSAAGLFPYIAGVTQIPMKLRSINSWLTHLMNAQLVDSVPEHRVFKTSHADRLDLLTSLEHLILPLLESMYVTLACLYRQESSKVSVENLINNAISVTSAMAEQKQDNTLNFYERRFFTTLVKKLQQYQQVIPNESGELQTHPNLLQIYERAQSVFDQKFITQVDSHLV